VFAAPVISVSEAADWVELSVFVSPVFGVSCDSLVDVRAFSSLVSAKAGRVTAEAISKRSVATRMYKISVFFIE
jgi:hypothetical protein